MMTFMVIYGDDFDDTAYLPGASSTSKNYRHEPSVLGAKRGSSYTGVTSSS